MSQPVRAATALAGALVAGALFIGCGVPQDDEPRMVSDGAVPFGLLDTTTSTMTTPTTRPIVTTIGS